MQFLQNMLGKSTETSSTNNNTGCQSGGATRSDGRVEYGFSLMRGKRANMEDYHHAKFKKDKVSGQEVGLFGVFDDFVRSNLFECLLNNTKFGQNLPEALAESFTETDKLYLGHDAANRDDGCTAVTAVLVGQRLIVANVGDSRAVLARGGQAIPLSDDHKPNRKDERERIEGLGGVVVWAGTWRVGGVLAVSRAFGDRLLKKYVVATPEIREEWLSQQDDALILASDGLWDVISNQDAIALIKDYKDAEKAAKRLTDEAFVRGSNDNISCIVVRFRY